jgi:hypothetical protein
LHAWTILTGIVLLFAFITANFAHTFAEAWNDIEILSDRGWPLTFSKTPAYRSQFSFSHLLYLGMGLAWLAFFDVLGITWSLLKSRRRTTEAVASNPLRRSASLCKGQQAVRSLRTPAHSLESFRGLTTFDTRAAPTQP